MNIFDGKRYCYYICLDCNHHLALFTKEAYYHIIDDSIALLNRKFKAKILGYCFLPHQVHLILYFEERVKTVDYIEELKKITGGEIIRLLKLAGSNHCIHKLKSSHSGQKHEVWMTVFEEEKIETIQQLKQLLDDLHLFHLDYISEGEEKNYTHSSAMFYSEGKQTAVKVTHYEEVDFS